MDTFESESRSVMSNSLQPHGLYNPWNYPGQNTGVADSLPTELLVKPDSSLGDIYSV